MSILNHRYFQMLDWNRIYPFAPETAKYISSHFGTYRYEIYNYILNHKELLPYINEEPAIAPYVCGCIKPDEGYPLMFENDFDTGIIATTSTSMSLIFKYLRQPPTNEPNSTLFMGGGAAGSGTKTWGLAIQTSNYASQFAFQVYDGARPYGNISGYVGQSLTCTCRQGYNSLSHDGTIIMQQSNSSNIKWYGGTSMQIYKNTVFGPKMLSLKEGGAETHRYYALTNNMIWDYITSTLINNNPTE